MKRSSVMHVPAKAPHERWLGLGLSVSLGLGLTLWCLSLMGANVFGQVKTAFAAPAATINVNTNLDELNSDGDCSLREAIQSANTNSVVDGCTAGSGADTINVPAGTYLLTVGSAGDDANAGGDLDATDANGLTLTGAGANQTILDGNGLDRVLHATAGPLTLNNVTVQHGSVIDNGGGVRFGSAATVNGSTFFSNTAAQQGGGAYFANVANVSGSSFLSNTAGQQSGGAHFQNISALTTTTFSYNRATTGNGGGARFIGMASVTGTTFSYNTAPNSGGGAYFLGSASLTDTTVLSNTAGQQGGGFSFANAAQLRNGTLGYNTALQGGGAYFNNTATIVGTTFMGNTATSNSGGGTHFQMAATVTGATFSQNQALGGLGGGGAYFNSTATVAGTTFNDNLASSDGGGANFVSTASVTDTTFANNMANAIGGGANFYGTVGVTNSVFTNNTAGLSGGGAYLTGMSTNAEQFVNVLFAANRSGGQGSALYVTHNGGNDTLTLQHATIASPTVGSNSAIYIVAGTVQITNSLLASYTVGVASIGGTISEDYNLFSGVPTPYSGTITSGGNSLTGTAAFADHLWYRLDSPSAAVDAGTNVNVSADFEGDPRPQGTGFDIGWDEVAPTPISGLSATNDSPTPANLTTHFLATVSAGTGVSYQWNFGDGNFGSGANANHVYGTAGTYTAIVTATNSLNSASASTLVTITEAATQTLFLPIIARQTGAPLTAPVTSTPAATLDLAVDTARVPPALVWFERRDRAINV